MRVPKDIFGLLIKRYFNRKTVYQCLFVSHWVRQQAIMKCPKYRKYLAKLADFKHLQRTFTDNAYFNCVLRRYRKDTRAKHLNLNRMDIRKYPQCDKCGMIRDANHKCSTKDCQECGANNPNLDGSPHKRRGCITPILLYNHFHNRQLKQWAATDRCIMVNP